MKRLSNVDRVNFWQIIPKPFFMLAPMHEITDPVFRRVITEVGNKPDVFMTEFVSADGLCSIGRNHLQHALKFTENERPIVAQIFGADPDKFFEAARLLKDMDFDGVDINMGCPNADVVKNGSGAALIKNFELAKKIIRATKNGAGGLPVSVKTRIGYSTPEEFYDWFPVLMEEGLAAIIIHARTRSQMYGGDANWKYITEAVRLRNKLNSKTLIVGNGDVRSLEDGLDRAHEVNKVLKVHKERGLDGIAIGRAAFDNPWIFSDNNNVGNEERFETLIKHAELYEETYSGIHSFARMKRFYRSYINGFDGAKELRMKLMEAGSAKDIRKALGVTRNT